MPADYNRLLSECVYHDYEKDFLVCNHTMQP